MAEPVRPPTVVLGAGVIGLSCAFELQNIGCQAVTIVAQDFPGPAETMDALAQIDYTSPWGGAHNRWVLPSSTTTGHREHEWSRKTYDTMEHLAKDHPEAGITFMKGIEYLEDPPPEYRALNEAQAQELGMEEFRLLPASELPPGVAWGCEYRTWCVNPMVYCSFLLRRFVSKGGKIMKRGVSKPADVFGLDSLRDYTHVVNATGRGFGDDDVFIIRGQTCLVANKCDATVTRQNKDGTWTFCVPRNFDGGTVIGGTKEPNNWGHTPSPTVRDSLLSNFAKTHPQILKRGEEFRVIRDIVGRRPARKGGLRLEREALGQEKVVIHAYGFGGRGYELSWGAAQEAAGIVFTAADPH